MRVVIAVVVTGAVAVTVDSAETEESVHKESDQPVETVAPVKPGRGHSVHKGSAPHAHKVNGQSGPPVRKETVRHANRVSELHELSRLQRVQRL